MQTRPRLADFVRAHRLSHEGRAFDGIATRLTHSVRRAMGVPDRAEPEIEEEFQYLRICLDDFRPEYEVAFGSLLWKHLGEGAKEALYAVEAKPVQEYLGSAVALRAAFESELQRIAGLLQDELEASGRLSPPAPSAAPADA